MILLILWIALSIFLWVIAIAAAISLLKNRTSGNSKQLLGCVVAWLIMGVLSGLKLSSMLQTATSPEVRRYTIIGYLLSVPVAFLIGMNVIYLPRWGRSDASSENAQPKLMGTLYSILLPVGLGLMGYIVLHGGMLIGQGFAK